MRYYTLEDKTQDQDFLAGKQIACRAVFPTSEKNEFVAGNNLIVVLSNGKKYKGTVIEFRNISIENYYIGELVIKRS